MKIQFILFINYMFNSDRGVAVKKEKTLDNEKLFELLVSCLKYGTNAFENRLPTILIQFATLTIAQP